MELNIILQSLQETGILIAPWIVITVWAIYPAGYLALLGQRLFVNRTRLINPMASARSTIEAIRTRGER